MINVASAIIMVVLLLFFWSLLKAGSDADDHWEELMREAKEADYDVH